MEYRQLGDTGIEVSVIGMGCWAIGGDAWGPVDDRDSIAAIRRALDLGITLFDTADVYGRGHSEELVAEAIGDRVDEVVIATKVGLWHSGSDRPNAYTDPAMVIESCEASLERLRTDRIDVYQCHVWWDENVEVFLDAFDRLRQQGKIRASGVSTNEPGHLRHFDSRSTCEILQFDHSILNRSPELELLPYAAERRMGTLARGSLRMGVLTGKFTEETTFPEGDVRRTWPEQDWYRQQLGKADALERELARDGRTLSQVALAYVLAQPGVSTTIPGAKAPAQVDQNAAAADVRLTDDDVAVIERVAPRPEPS